MKALIKDFINFYIYSSLHIGLCAAFLYQFNVQRFYLSVDLEYAIFLVAGSIFIYSLHRLIGVLFIDKENQTERFLVVRKFRNHLIFYTIVSAAFSLYFVYYFDISRLILLVFAGLLSLLYTLPIFSHRRLRDLPFIKIFLIAIVWTYLTLVMPLFEQGVDMNIIYFYSASQILFFLGLTIPFDIRDIDIDNLNQVKTLATSHTMNQLHLISFYLIASSTILEIIGYYAFENENTSGLISIILAHLTTIYLIYKFRNKKHDYYYGGILDAMIMLPYLLYLIFTL